MKTISTLTAALLIIASFHASANENIGKSSINLPSPIVATAEDVNAKELEELKSNVNFLLPSIPELTPEDVDAKELEELKSNVNFLLPSIPELNQEDLDIKEIEQLRVQAPEMVWRSPSDVDTAQLESLKHSFIVLLFPEVDIDATNLCPKNNKHQVYKI
ncbi:hypothetical protein ADIARSV_2266 [Arcticibacter svalbardensis MN12-7]|uniref:Uncharacterized protein n=1 Tax=Arcticibacter svalbardensis MN12-7 TaxID=1150600 RepID=R9GSM6_9SPHI|nr:hypothetical protein [Arcticibacter svalbardensis]EOR94668.1 hypothetical protein ADIARSV_2266 [Arcticibacter svalbardensis MN12-7]